jgi:hypothetical protein
MPNALFNIAFLSSSFCGFLYFFCLQSCGFPFADLSLHYHAALFCLIYMVNHHGKHAVHHSHYALDVFADSGQPLVHLAQFGKLAVH